MCNKLCKQQAAITEEQIRETAVKAATKVSETLAELLQNADKIYAWIKQK